LIISEQSGGLDMDELIKEINEGLGNTIHNAVNLTVTEVILCLLLSFILSCIIAWVYRKNHSQISYSQSFSHTIIIMGTIVSLIMLIIGSNIARAFSLVGALSIIRFRSAIKEPQDVAYLFFAMAIGMGCGTRFYAVSIAACIFVSALIFIMNIFRIGSITEQNMLLKILLPVNIDYTEQFQKVFEDHLKNFRHISAETVRNGLFNRLTYSINLKQNTTQYRFIEDLKKYNDNNEIQILNQDHRDI
jgi:uncharacterized membrane protein YhiD involved in acid resistance